MARKKKVEELAEVINMVATATSEGGHSIGESMKSIAENIDTSPTPSMLQQLQLIADTQDENLPLHIDFNGIDVEIIQYLPVDKKLVFVEMVKQNSFNDEGVYSDILNEMFFQYMLVQYYTNFEIPDSVGFFEAYDLLRTSGLIGRVIIEMNFEEFQYMDASCQMAIEQHRQEIVANKNNVMGAITKVINGLDDKLPAMMESLKNVSPEMFKNLSTVIDFNNGKLKS